MQPMIGVTASVQAEVRTVVHNDHVNAVVEAGGIPIVLPNLLDEENIGRLARLVDGLLVTGGDDIDPTLFGEEPHPSLGEIIPERDHFEMSLIQKLLKQDKPILAICRGCQILNIAAGGDMFQDIYTQQDRELLQHQQRAPRSHCSHYVHPEKDTLLWRLSRGSRFKVNSFHHQAVRRLAKGFKLSATSSDGIIEAIESESHRFVLGVQWHPEALVKKEDPYAVRIFNEFIEVCKTPV
jgi:putative glutamine amidotransferase